jgi:hypothetical protein
LGILGTLAATWLTNHYNGKRDERQWKWQKQLQDERLERDREQEALQWRREREERIEQWEREDAKRWNADLSTAYSKVISSIILWTQCARKILSAEQSRSGVLDIDPSVVSELENLRTAAVDATRRVELWATKEIRDTAWLAVAMCGQFERSAATLLESEHTGVNLAERLGPKFDAVEVALRDLYRRIRSELGIDLDADGGPSTATH